MLLLFYSIFLLPTLAVVGYEFNASSPMPTSVMSRQANMSKPRLIIPHVTDYTDYFTLVIPIGMQMAIEGLAKVTPHLKDFELQVDLYESYCADSYFVDETMTFLEQEKKEEYLPVHIALGCPAVGQRMLGEIAHHYNITSLTTIDVVTESYHDRRRFRNFHTLGESLETIHSALLAFMKEQGWTRVALLG